MTNEKLSMEEILELKTYAHHLNPVVMAGQQSLTEVVIREADAALTTHKLIEIRTFGDDRAEHTAICDTLREVIDAQPVQRIGRFSVLWRKNPEA